MIGIADSSPIRYLVLIGEVEIPSPVYAELTDPQAQSCRNARLVRLHGAGVSLCVVLRPHALRPGHDHPGIRTTSWLGVRYPDAVRYDLPVLQILFLPVLPILFHVLGRRDRAPGFYLAVFLGAYSLLRLALDRLHVDVVRYFGLSVDQWGSIFAILTGVGGY